MIDVPASCDVVVVGGGPAGSLTATYLCDKGYSVVLLEKQKHPRPKVGESLIPEFWKYLELAGLGERIRDEGFIAKAGGVVTWKGETQALSFADFGFDKPALHVERDRFDWILLDHARSRGAAVFEEVEVTDMSFEVDEDDRESATVTYRAAGADSAGQISCRYAVDATGQNALLARRFGYRQMDDAFRFLSVWGYFQNSKFVSPEGMAHPFEDLKTVAPVTYVTSVEGAGDSGWTWHIPLRETTSVGLVLPLDMVKAARRKGEDWEEFFERLCRELPGLSSLLEEATLEVGSVSTIRDYSYRSTTVAGPGYFLVGDAAGFVDPIFSVGVVLGMYTAAAAAWAIDRCLASPSSTESSRRMFASQLHAKLEVARSLALPRYRTSGEVSDLARATVQFERPDSRDLMYAVSSMTTRSENWHDMMPASQAPDLSDGRVRVLSELDVS